jgi:hypothetical protein
MLTPIKFKSIGSFDYHIIVISRTLTRRSQSDLTASIDMMREHSTDHVCSVDCVNNVYDQKSTSLIQNMHISGKFLTGA